MRTPRHEHKHIGSFLFLASHYILWPCGAWWPGKAVWDHPASAGYILIREENMINADYELLSITADDGEKYAFRDKERMYRFLKEIVKEEYKKIPYSGKPFIYKRITK